MVQPEDLDAIVLETLSAFVGGEGGVVSAVTTAPTLSARVGLAGEYDGKAVDVVVEVLCDDRTAAVLTGCMLGLSADECEQGDIVDAMGEVANTIGGNVKAVLGEGLKLSLPKVMAAGVEHPCELSRSYRLEELELQVVVCARNDCSCEDER